MTDPMPAMAPLMDVIVFLAMAFAVVFLLAWAASPRLRAWIERPKYRFQENVRSYDREGHI
ncbi:MAG: hypothetical protein LAO79_09985 [Acidobacteriia bacterium]|nr:hypothetical protein [Terriglobia bacterium]